MGKDLDHLVEHVLQLEERLATQGRMILQLRATIGSLVEELAAEHDLDAAKLGKKVEEAWQELLHPSPPTPPGVLAASPYRKADPQDEHRVCVRCKAIVPLAQSTVTETGLVCDRCLGI
jgi:hypothetical protein